MPNHGIAVDVSLVFFATLDNAIAKQIAFTNKGEVQRVVNKTVLTGANNQSEFMIMCKGFTE